MFDTSALYTLEKGGLLSSDSLNFIYDLYLPIIGHDSVFLYLFFMNEIIGNSKTGTINDLINKTGFTLQEFLLSKKNLESIGLLRTYEKTSIKSYYFVINDPETPKNFFANLLLKGLFVDSTNNERYEAVLAKYCSKPQLTGFKEISAGVHDSFKLNFKYEQIQKDGDIKLEGRNRNTLKDNFSEVKLLNYLQKTYNLSSKHFSNEEITNIHRLASLYGLSEFKMGDLVDSCFNMLAPLGNRVDINKLRKMALVYVKNFDVSLQKRHKTKSEIPNSTSDIAKLVNYYEATSPIDLIKSRQNNIEVVAADRKIVDMLAFDMGFSNGMINALLDYVMKHTDGELNKNYISKIAANLIRKGAQDSLSVLELLNGHLKQTEIKKDKNVKKDVIKEVAEIKKPEDNIDDDDMDYLDI